ncbi:MAG: GNAT family N-acetyltransferase [Chloroflexi bacterium]|nr:GNAT family N-acetyltransferase [Chloroflexota bacterium]
MALIPSLQVRPAEPGDQRQIASLMNFEPHVHRHLDWRDPLDWLGESPFHIAQQHGHLVAALACPPDPPAVAWLRLFTCSDSIPLEGAWQSLWEAAQVYLKRRGSFTAAAIVMNGWFGEVLFRSGFSTRQEIVMLAWNGADGRPATLPDGFRIRSMTPADLPSVARMDLTSFAPLWHNSISALKHAYTLAAIATVAENEDNLLGYQFSTTNSSGGHLARLAVRPEAQGRNIGSALGMDLLGRFRQRGIRRVTVNTQSDNAISLRLYRKIGFQPTGEHFPVYSYQVE